MKHPEHTTPTPAGLSKATGTWFRETVERWVLDPHHIRLLTIAAFTYDEQQQAQRLVRKQGLVITNARGRRVAHPAIKIANDARVIFCRALRELDLDLEPPAAAKRPPLLHAFRGGQHAT